MTATPPALLFGPYRTPRFKYGQRLVCAVRGELEAVKLTDAPIPWPVGKRGRLRAIIVCGDLAKAVRRESLVAIMHWWGVGNSTVQAWRRALGVAAVNEGTSALKSEIFRGEAGRIARKAGHPTLSSPARRAKIAAAKRGKPRPPAVVEQMRLRMLGQRLSDATKAKLSAVHRARGTRPPKAGRPWTAAEDELLQRLPVKDVARETGRTLSAVYMRRHLLGLPDGRRRS